MMKPKLSILIIIVIIVIIVIDLIVDDGNGRCGGQIGDSTRRYQLPSFRAPRPIYPNVNWTLPTGSLPTDQKPIGLPPGDSTPRYQLPSFRAPGPIYPNVNRTLPTGSLPTDQKPIGLPLGGSRPRHQLPSSRTPRPIYPNVNRTLPRGSLPTDHKPIGLPPDPPPYGFNLPRYYPGPTSHPPPYPGAPPANQPLPSYKGGTFHPTPYPQQPAGNRPRGNYHSHGQHYPARGGNTIINKNINNRHVSYTPPFYSSYIYRSSDTGSGTLGFFLRYTLAKLTTPTYHRYSTTFYDGYRPRYDHYEVHHYYHNNNSTIIEREKVLEPNTIVGCVGDSGSICPANTTSLCTNEGAIMCIASATTTVPCKKEKDANCVKSTVPCVNSTVPGCEARQKNAQVSIPCISTAKIHGQISYVNNTIIVKNATAANATTYNSTNGKATLPRANTTSTNGSTIGKKEVKDTQDFCITILALPAKKEAIRGRDQILKMAEKSFVKALGL